MEGRTGRSTGPAREPHRRHRLLRRQIHAEPIGVELVEGAPTTTPLSLVA